MRDRALLRRVLLQGRRREVSQSPPGHPFGAALQGLQGPALRKGFESKVRSPY